MKLRSLRRPAVLTAASVAVLAVAFSGTAVADALLTGDDIKNGTLTGKDIDNGSIKGKDIKDNSLEKGDLDSNSVGSSELRDGAVGLNHLSAKAIAGLQGEAPVAGPDSGLVESNWGVNLRNTQGAASADLRQGPFFMDGGNKVSPSAGSGSLMLQSSGQQSKVDFGNEVDFSGKNLLDVLGNKVSFDVLTTGENAKRGGASHLPVLRIEVDPNAAGTTDYGTLVWVANKGVSTAWETLDLTDADKGGWYLTDRGNTTNGQGTGCTLGTTCTFDEVTEKFSGAKVLSVSIGTNGTGAADWLGSVDNLRIGDTNYDFEARGVFATKA